MEMIKVVIKIGWPETKADVELYQLPCYIEVGTLSLHSGAKSISIFLFSLSIYTSIHVLIN